MAVARCWRRLLKLLGMPARDIQRAQVAAAGFAGSITASVRAASFSGPSTSTEVPFSLEQLTPDQQARLRAAFNRFDGDKSGQISAPEMLQVSLRAAVLTLGLRRRSCGHVVDYSTDLIDGALTLPRVPLSFRSSDYSAQTRAKRSSRLYCKRSIEITMASSTF